MRRTLQRNHSRLLVAKFFFLALFLVIAVRAFQLQVLQGERLMRLDRLQQRNQQRELASHVCKRRRRSDPLRLDLQDRDLVEQLAP